MTDDRAERAALADLHALCVELRGMCPAKTPRGELYVGPCGTCAVCRAQGILFERYKAALLRAGTPEGEI